jgi:ATP-binding cassette subfamily F protein 3
MLLNPVNFIILDEPTNHIDVQTKEILQGALSDYEGTLLIVSHDRSFLDNLVQKVYELKNGQLKCYLGNYSDYHDKKIIEQSASESAQNPSSRNDQKFQAREIYQKTKEEQRRIAAEQRRKDKHIRSIEEKIEKAEQNKSALELQLADPELYKNADQSISVQKEYQATMKQLDDLYWQWESAEKN